MKIYTRTGDDGTTGLFGAGRVGKNDPRIEAYGTVDELNAVLGLACAANPPAEIADVLRRVQHELFELGAELATPDPGAKGVPTIGPPHIARLEEAIDRHEAQLAPLRQFILPGGCPAAAWLHLARTVARRAERRVVSLAGAQPISPQVVVYLNRLSDLLFVLARATNAASQVPDVPWQRP
jgi:cob(I)alamin adenosyltransferase